MIMHIVIRPETIEISSHRRATGVVYFAADQDVFPEANWNDFVDLLLLEWSRQLLGVVSGKAEQATLRFMDGPFSVGLVCEANQCKALFKHGDEMVGSVDNIGLISLIQSLVSASESVLSSHTFRTGMPKQAAELRVAINQLKSALPQNEGAH
jgi:hypothetical protein